MLRTIRKSGEDPKMQKTRPLIVISSRTGNTMILGHAIADALPGALLVKPTELPEDLSPFNPVLLGYWRDLEEAPADMRAIASRFEGKTIGCFATMGSDVNDPDSQAWMKRTAEGLAAAGKNNTLAQTFICRGRIDPAQFEKMTKMMGGVVSPERAEKRRESETHPDRLDLAKGAEIFRSVFGVNF